MVTVNVWVAGEASVLPAASVARTLKMWLPAASVEVVRGLVHVTQLPESTLHWKVLPDSVEVNAKVGLVLVVLLGGPELIRVSGAVVSGGGRVVMVNVAVAGVVSVLPAVSV